MDINWKNVTDLVVAMLIAWVIIEIMGYGLTAARTSIAKRKAAKAAGGSNYDHFNDGTISDEEMEAYLAAA
jgi:hypothetical protein